MVYTVKQLARIAGISSRTLHYYDEVGLLKPSYKKENGYRCYEERELIKLQQILFFRELEFSLDQIKSMLNDPDFNELSALYDQRKLLFMEKTRLEGLLHTIDKTISTMKGGAKMNTDDLYNAFTKEEIERYKDEVKTRWGNTEAYKQSAERTKHWTKDDYARIKKEGEDITQSIAEEIDKGIESKEVQDLIQKHYTHIAQFYDLPYMMYRNLGKMYISDDRVCKIVCVKI